MAKFFSWLADKWRISGILDKLAFFATALGVTFILGFLILAAGGRIGLLIAKSGSMTPQVSPGTLLVFKPADIEDVVAGQIVVFKEGRSSNSLVIHRAVGKDYTEDKLCLRTKGDSNKRPDSDPVTADELVGVAIATIPFAGRILAFAKTSLGMFVLNFMLAFFLLLLALDRVRVKERMRVAQAFADSQGTEDTISAGDVMIKNPHVEVHKRVKGLIKPFRQK